MTLTSVLDYGTYAIGFSQPLGSQKDCNYHDLHFCHQDPETQQAQSLIAEKSGDLRPALLTRL